MELVRADLENPNLPSDFFDVTCLLVEKCGPVPDVPDNSRANVQNSLYGGKVTITCNTGYERADALGFSATRTCGLNNTFSDYDPPGFVCVRLSCGQYCRYCTDRSSGDFFGPCCTRPPDVDIDPNSDFKPVINGRVSGSNIALYESAVTLVCNGGYYVLPGSGSEQPACGARPDCSYDYANRDGVYNGWNILGCRDYRGWYASGVVCGNKAATPIVTTQAAPGASPCLPTDIQCEFARVVNVSMYTLTPGATIYYTIEEVASPVTAPSGLSPSVAANQAFRFGGTFALTVRIDGCNILAEYRRVRAVAVARGYANSDMHTSPLLVINTANGLLPATFRQCEAMVPDAFMWCSGLEPKPLTKADCDADPIRKWEFLPAREAYGGCVTYRFWMFAPRALQSTTVDFWSLSEIVFFFRGRKVEGVRPFSEGVYPGGESPWSLVDGDPVSKFTGLDRFCASFPPHQPTLLLGMSRCCCRGPGGGRLVVSLPETGSVRPSL